MVTDASAWSRLRDRLHGHRNALLISGAILLAAALMVVLSLRREPPITYAPTHPEPRPAADSLAGPVRVTLDTSDPERWVYFDLSRGAVVDRATSDEWDLGFRRFNIRVNGGAGFDGRAGVVDLGEIPFDSTPRLAAAGYVESDPRDSANAAIDRWYDYGFTSHLLTPKPRVYGIRTAEGQYAKLRFLSYYCPGARPGCVTFEYMLQGDGR